jgi:hypothetical protein
MGEMEKPLWHIKEKARTNPGRLELHHPLLAEANQMGA